MTALSLTITNDSDHGTDGNNDTILTFAGQNGANDYLLVLEDFTTDLTYTDFEVIKNHLIAGYIKLSKKALASCLMVCFFHLTFYR